MHTHLGLSSLSFCHFLFLSAVSASSPKMHLRACGLHCWGLLVLWQGVGELIYALSSLFITANAYYDIQVTFQTVSMQISGGLVEPLYGSVWMDGDIQLNSGKVPPPVPCPNTPFSGPFYGQATSNECEFGIICCRTASRLTTPQRMQCPKVSTQACA